VLRATQFIGAALVQRLKAWLKVLALVAQEPRYLRNLKGVLGEILSRQVGRISLKISPNQTFSDARRRIKVRRLIPSA
jgi:hypothetical protein